MAVYVVAQVLNVKDPADFEDYRQKVRASVQPHGGRFLVAGGDPQAWEGDSALGMAIIEFPSQEQARAWYESAEYQPLKEQRLRSADAKLTLVRGV